MLMVIYLRERGYVLRALKEKFFPGGCKRRSQPFFGSETRIIGSSLHLLLEGVVFCMKYETFLEDYTFATPMLLTYSFN